MKKLNFKDFLKKYNLKIDTTNKSHLQRVYNYHMYPGGSKKCSAKGFVNIDNGSQVGTHWTCFVIRDNKSIHFDSFGGKPDTFLLYQLPKPIMYHNYKILI